MRPPQIRRRPSASIPGPETGRGGAVPRASCRWRPRCERGGYALFFPAAVAERRSRRVRETVTASTSLSRARANGATLLRVQELGTRPPFLIAAWSQMALKRTLSGAETLAAQLTIHCGGPCGRNLVQW